MESKRMELYGEELNITYGRYPNGRTAILVVAKETGEPFCTASANLPLSQYPVKENEVLIKNYSENEGILGQLIKGGIVSDTGRTVPSGFVSLNVCQLLTQE